MSFVLNILLAFGLCFSDQNNKEAKRIEEPDLNGFHEKYNKPFIDEKTGLNYYLNLFNIFTPPPRLSKYIDYSLIACNFSSDKCLPIIPKNQQIIHSTQKPNSIHIEFTSDKPIFNIKKWKLNFNFKQAFTDILSSIETVDDTIIFTITLNTKTTNSNQEKCYFTTTQGTRTIEFNASLFDTEDGYQIISHSVPGISLNDDISVFYQPCSLMPCPLFMTCPHEKEAYLWVCDDMPTCAGFGTFDGGISLKQISSSQIFSGIRVSYSNNQSLFSYVDYFCDYSLKKGEIKLLDSTLVLSANGKIFHFQALSRDACPLGDVLPTPQPFYPSIPEPGHTSTPSPIPSPNGKFFTYNETHYIEFDLKNFDQSTHSSLHILTWKDNVRDLDVYMSLWDGTKCPPGYMCNEFQDDVANVWGCWIDADLKAICFPIGNLSEDIRIEELGKGIMVSYNGLYGTKTEFRYQCDENLGDYNYVLENGVGYHSGLSGVEYSFDARSGGICQKAFIAPEFPHFTPSPSPVVMGDPIIQKTLYSEDKVIDFDLSEMNVQNIQAILRNTDGYENVLISFSPNKRTDCIAGYNCGDFDDANVWLCWEEKRCFPVGDARYGYTIELVDDSDLGRGVNLTVNGGLGGYMTTVIFSCNMSAKSVSFEQFGEIDQRVILYASSTNACVTDRVENFKIGSMFLLVILTLITVYLSFGTFIGYCARKDIFMPNENFWNEFSLCVKEALSFIFSCRRSHDEYVNI